MTYLLRRLMGGRVIHGVPSDDLSDAYTPAVCGATPNPTTGGWQRPGRVKTLCPQCSEVLLTELDDLLTRQEVERD